VELNADTVRSNRSNLLLFESTGEHAMTTADYLARRLWDMSPVPHSSSEGGFSIDDDISPHKTEIPELNSTKDAKLGTFMGVFIPCCSNILGIIIFVRLAWIVGQGGIAHAFLIALIACTCVGLLISCAL
jgi:hypothetical protein